MWPGPILPVGKNPSQWLITTYSNINEKQPEEEQWKYHITTNESEIWVKKTASNAGNSQDMPVFKALEWARGKRCPLPRPVHAQAFKGSSPNSHFHTL